MFLFTGTAVGKIASYQFKEDYVYFVPIHMNEIYVKFMNELSLEYILGLFKNGDLI